LFSQIYKAYTLVYIALNAIGVDSKYRRKGIGQKLTQWGIDKATAAEQDIWLIATDSGRRLYDSVGFKMICGGERCGEPQFVMLKMHEQ
jgi:ribosomal protein S18 acetylase RimI-like enzyme